MDRKYLIGAIVIVIILAAVFYLTQQPAPTPEPELEGELSLSEAYLELGDTWRNEGIELDALDLSDDAAIKAIPDSQLESVKDNLAVFKAGLDEDYPDKEALEALADVFALKVDMVLAQKAYLLAEDRANILASDSAEQVCAKLDQALIDSLEAYIDAYSLYVEEGQAFMIAFGGESLSVDFFVGEEEEDYLIALNELYGGYVQALANC